MSRRLRLHRSASLQQSGSLVFNVSIEDQLRISLEFDGNRFPQAEMQQLANDFADKIETMVSHATSAGAGQVSASDFPLANLDADQLKNLASLMNRNDCKGDTQK